MSAQSGLPVIPPTRSWDEITHLLGTDSRAVALGALTPAPRYYQTYAGKGAGVLECAWCQSLIDRRGEYRSVQTLTRYLALCQDLDACLLRKACE